MTSKTDRIFNLWVLLLQTRDAVYNARYKELAKCDVSPRESATLRAIVSIGAEATPAKLARWEYRKPHTMAAILNRMQKRGFIKLSKDKIMKNLVRITITEEGEKAYKAARKRDSLIRSFRGIPEENFGQLESSLTMIRDQALKLTGDSIERTSV
jgi:DNA-binding MarR family transcriptional regulator